MALHLNSTVLHSLTWEGLVVTFGAHLLGYYFGKKFYRQAYVTTRNKQICKGQKKPSELKSQKPVKSLNVLYLSLS
jgi:hypothetical protein